MARVGGMYCLLDWGGKRYGAALFSSLLTCAMGFRDYFIAASLEIRNLIPFSL